MDEHLEEFETEIRGTKRKRVQQKRNEEQAKIHVKHDENIGKINENTKSEVVLGWERQSSTNLHYKKRAN